MATISAEISEQEITDWLDYKKIFQKERDKNEDSIELLINAMCDGVIMIDSETKEITHNLLFPIGEDDPITELKYRSRINDKILSSYMKGVKATDADGRLTAYVSALTKQASGIIKALDSVDKKISTAIAIFFL